MVTQSRIELVVQSGNLQVLKQNRLGRLLELGQLLLDLLLVDAHRRLVEEWTLVKFATSLAAAEVVCYLLIDCLRPHVDFRSLSLLGALLETHLAHEILVLFDLTLDPALLLVDLVDVLVNLVLILLPLLVFLSQRGEFPDQVLVILGLLANLLP